MDSTTQVMILNAGVLAIGAVFVIGFIYLVIDLIRNG